MNTFSLDESRTNDIPQVTELENEQLIKPFNEEEVRHAVFSMVHNKATTGNTLRVPPASKCTNIASASTPVPADQKANRKLKGTVGAEDKEVLVDPNNLDKKLRISTNLDPK
jgi:hypothetical protein